jgi:hypothetical protein
MDRSSKETLTQEPLMVKEFISTFSASLDPRLWINLVIEEIEELEEALLAEDPEGILKEMSDLMYVTLGFNMVAAGAEQLALMPQEEHTEYVELLNTVGLRHQEAIDFFSKPVNFYEAFRRVHMSNMSKLDSDGKPIKRDDGKILKSENYKPAELGDLV